MTNDDIIRMAQEAGLFVPQAGIPENGALMRFAALVAAAERERIIQFLREMQRVVGDAHNHYGIAAVRIKEGV